MLKKHYLEFRYRVKFSFVSIQNILPQRDVLNNVHIKTKELFAPECFIRWKVVCTFSHLCQNSWIKIDQNKENAWLGAHTSLFCQPAVRSAGVFVVNAHAVLRVLWGRSFCLRRLCDASQPEWYLTWTVMIKSVERWMEASECEWMNESAYIYIWHIKASWANIGCAHRLDFWSRMPGKREKKRSLITFVGRTKSYILSLFGPSHI
jgi:hypothetical protein